MTNQPIYDFGIGLVKPRIRKDPWKYSFFAGDWTCVGNGWTVRGGTPSEAYRGWLTKVRHELSPFVKGQYVER